MQKIALASGIILFSFFSIFAFSLFSHLSSAQTSSTANLPHLVPYVNDYAGVLTPDEVSAINSLAAQIEQNSTVQVAVLTVNTTQPLDIDQYANEVFRASGIGHKDNNNGVLVMVAVNDRQWRIEVGYGVEGVLPDALAGQIGLTYMVPNFKNGNYGQGLYLAVQSIGNVVEGSGDPSIVSQQSSSYSGSTSDAIFTFLPWMIFFGLAMIPVAISDISRCPKCGKFAIGHSDQDFTYFKCKNGHTWKKKKKARWMFFFFGSGFGGRGGGGWGGGGGGGFGGGSSGGGGAGGGF